jgi:Ser/Thr protein kinase RdoA (MazF antagonist)
LRDRLNAVPRGRDAFGAAHLDLGYSNFFLNGGRLELFDFDNCTAAPYAADIAFALYGSLFTLLRRDFPGDRSAFEHPKAGQNLERVWNPFREGYASEHAWPEAWNGELDGWMEAVYLRSVVHAFRIQHPVTDPKAAAALRADVENLLRGTFPLRFDFRKGKAET